MKAKIIYDKKINISSELEEMISLGGEGYGAIMVYIGVVKGVVEGKKVLELKYECIPNLAEKKIRELAEEALNSDGIGDVRIYHRIGSFKPGEPVLYILVAGVSRKNVYNVMKDLVEKVKHELPVWKMEVREDGVYWVVSDGLRVRREFKGKI